MAAEIDDEDDADSEVVTIDQAVAIAVDLLRKRQLKAASGLLETILENMPDHPDALNYLGMTRFHLEGPEQGVRFLERAAHIAPDHAGIRNNLGNAYVDMGKIDDAAFSYEKAIELDPMLADPYSNLALIVRRTGDNAHAEKLLRKAIEIHPEFGVAYQNLAVTLLEIGKPKEAIDYFWKATAYLPDKGVPAHFLAMAYWFGGLKEIAIEFVDRWARDHPDDPQAQHMHAAITGEHVPDRASNVYVRKLFDQFAGSFDSKLESLQYRAPELVGNAMREAAGSAAASLRILDAGCGTGKCAVYLRPLASHLAGVDLSTGMLLKAERLGLYDRLQDGELTEFLANSRCEYDAVVSADTLCYFGRLEGFAAAAANAITPGGHLVFTVEALEGEPCDGFQLLVNGRYAHSEDYVRNLLAANFEAVSCSREKLRMENAEPVIGLLFVARRTSPGHRL